MKGVVVFKLKYWIHMKFKTINKMINKEIVELNQRFSMECI